MKIENGKFNVSQKYEIIPPQSGKAYPIGLQEWNYIKKKITEIKVEVNNFHAIGFLLLGASVSCLITILGTNFADEKSKYFCWALLFITLLTGLLSIYFATDKHKQEDAKPIQVLDQMRLIESRFESQD